MVKTPKLLIILLNWNGTKDTTECIESIRANTYQNYTIVLVDNGSDKENLQDIKNWCEHNFKNVTYYNTEEARTGGISSKESLLTQVDSDQRIVFIDNKKNLGFAVGNNVALNYALNLGVEFTLILNNDTIVDRNSISHLMDFLLTNQDFVAVTPQIRYYNSIDKIWNCGGKIIFPGFRKYYYAEKSCNTLPKNGYRQITFVTGCALLMKIKETGILTEKFFFGEEDFELSWRLNKEHKKYACCFDAIIYHKINASIQKTSNNIGSTVLQYSQRLINLKFLTNKITYFLYVLLQFSYSVIMMKIRYNLSIKTGLLIWKKIFYYSSHYKGVDTKLFNTIIKEN